jgi:uncharacterized SAM-binding protein YcdF (DUF218 family)
MLLFFSKLVAAAFYPVGFSCLLIPVAVVFGILGRKRTALFILFVSISALWFFSTPVVSDMLVKSLESKFTQPAHIPNASAIVLLGGFTRPALSPRRHVEIGFAGDRLLGAVRLFKENKAPYIVCTGGKIPFLLDFPGTEASNMASLLRDLWNIDSSSILIEDKAQNTHDHGPKVRAIFEQRGMKKDIILVTSAMHMYRSVKIFKKNGFTVYPAPADFWCESKSPFVLFKILPGADALNASTTALHEYYGLLAYKVMGWL